MSLFNHKDGDLLLERVRETPIDFAEIELERAHEAANRDRHVEGQESAPGQSPARSHKNEQGPI